MGRIYIGTSAFSEPGWRGRFYPPDLSPEGMLTYYAEHLAAVEINSTFYRMPTPDLLARWAAQVPPAFRFAIKAPRRVGLAPGPALDRLLQVLPALGAHLGAVMFQLPRFAPLDPEGLSALLARLPPGLPAAFDFGHPVAEVDDLLRSAGAARVGVDDAPPLPGRGFVYIRLRQASFPSAVWAERLRRHAASGLDVYAFVKHAPDVDSPGRAVALAQEVARSPAYR